MTISDELRPRISAAYADRSLLADPSYVAAVHTALEALDRGELRVASPDGSSREGPDGWTTHAWVKEAILLYFALQKMAVHEVGPFEFHDMIPLKKGFAAAGVRVVPPGTVRYGAFLERGAVLMPGYVNIGARVGSGTMVDTWATVGSCAQIGRGCTCRAASASAASSSRRGRDRSSSRTGPSSGRGSSSSRGSTSAARRSSARGSCSRRRRRSWT